MATGIKTGGRKKGTPNKITADIRKAAQAYGDKAIKGLASIAEKTDAPEAARVAAWRELLDRGYGKSSQPVDGDGQGGPIQHSLEVRFVKAKA